MVDIKVVLGRASITMTARYAHASDDGTRREVEAIPGAAGHTPGKKEGPQLGPSIVV
jgi:hypothetical protein